MEQWKTFPVFCRGGLVLSKDSLEQATQFPGTALSLINYEAALEGGYRRIKGYTKYDTNTVSGSGVMKGVFVFNGGVIAERGTEIYRSTGSGWTAINGLDTRTGSVKLRATFYSWTTNKIAMVDGGSGLYPATYTSGGTYTSLTNAPTGQTLIQEYNRHLFLSSGTEVLTHSAPGAENDYNAINGAGTINIGMPLVGMAVWRDELYLFSNNKIKKLTGTSTQNWQLVNIAQNIGCVNPDSIQEVNGDIVFLSDDGLRTISGTVRLGDRELGNISSDINSITSVVSHSDIASVVIRDKNQYRLFSATSSVDPASAIGVIGVLKDDEWNWSVTSGLKVACAHSAIASAEQLSVFGAWDGYVYKLESGDTFDGTAIQSVYKTPNFVFSDPDQRKVLYRLCCFLQTDGVLTLNVGTTIDFLKSNIVQPSSKTIGTEGGSIFFDSSSITLFDSGADVYFDAISAQKPCTNLTGSCTSASFTFNSAGGASHVIQSLSIQYREAAKR